MVPKVCWPRTVLDAVEVTKHLGEQYLWVDRLCIDQSNLQEKQFLISKMDAIYDGAEFTIVAAAGDASTGLPGVMMTPRIPQPRVELKARSQTIDGANLTNPAGSTPDAVCQLLGITKEEYEETGNDRRWLDPHRHGLRSHNKIDMSELLKDEDILKRHKISREHLRVFQDFADDYEHPIEEWMIKMEQMAQKKRIPLQDLVPYLLRETAIRAGIPEDATADMTFIPPKPTTCSSKTERPLPPSAIAGRTILYLPWRMLGLPSKTPSGPREPGRTRKASFPIAGSSLPSIRCTGSAVAWPRTSRLISL